MENTVEKHNIYLRKYFKKFIDYMDFDSNVDLHQEDQFEPINLVLKRQGKPPIVIASVSFENQRKIFNETGLNKDGIIKPGKDALRSEWFVYYDKVKNNPGGNISNVTLSDIAKFMDEKENYCKKLHVRYLRGENIDRKNKRKVNQK